MPVAMTQLGRAGPGVSRVGLGLMATSGAYGPADEAESKATIRAALDAGITLLGARRRDRLAEALGTAELTLDTDDLATIEAAVPAAAVAGTRYDPAQIAGLDSEKP